MSFNGGMLIAIRLRLPELNEEAAKVVLGSALIAALALPPTLPLTVHERVARLLRVKVL